MLVPVVYAVLGGFRDQRADRQRPGRAAEPVGVRQLQRDPQLAATFWRQLCNSTLIALVSTLLTVPLAALAAFVFARFAFPGREVLYAVFTLGLLFPVAVAILPIFIMVRNLGLLDNPLGVALPQAAFGLPLTIVILRPFFASFPNELQDAAAIDGCGPFRFFWRILLPLSPARAGHGLRAGHRRLLERVPAAARRVDRRQPLDAAARRDQLLPAVHGRHRQDPRLHDAVDGAGAGVLRVPLSMVPALVFYAFAERHLVAGLTTGAVKG